MVTVGTPEPQVGASPTTARHCLLRGWLGTESRVLSRYLLLVDGGVARSGQGLDSGAAPLNCSRTPCCRRWASSSRRMERRVRER
jgi:hypothetical protein